MGIKAGTRFERHTLLICRPPLTLQRRGPTTLLLDDLLPAEPPTESITCDAAISAKDFEGTEVGLDTIACRAAIEAQEKVGDTLTCEAAVSARERCGKGAEAFADLQCEVAVSVREWATQTTEEVATQSEVEQALQSMQQHALEMLDSGSDHC